jgi:NAD dependent epimerase/dehydratase family enzyme
VRNAGLAKALGRALRRPALLPVPALALKALYGEMAQVVTSGARVVPAKALMNGYAFRYAQIDSALQAALGRR